MPFSSDRAVLAMLRLSYEPVRQIAEDHTIGNLVVDAGLPALVLERPWTASQIARPIQALRDSRAGDLYSLRSGRLSPVAEDRPHFYVATLRAAYADAPASWPSWPGLVSATRLTLYHWARALYARQAGSRLPLIVEDGRSQISGDVRVQRKASESPPRLSCPMLPDVLAYHRRDNLPGQIRA